MKKFLRLLSFVFAAGALGGLANGGVLYAIHRAGWLAAIGVRMPVAGSWPWLYQRIVWGGIWGVLFLSPILKKTVLLRGIVLSVAPTLVQLLVVFPFTTNGGWLGLGYGVLTPVAVVAVNAVWGVAADLYLRAVDQR